jgi:hypothetical protein
MRSRQRFNAESISALEKLKDKAEDSESSSTSEGEDENVPPEIPSSTNRDLEELLTFYECHDLLPYAQHIMWLASVKEALGYIPFNLDYFTIRCLTVLQEEVNKKSVKDSQEMRSKSDSSSFGSSIGLEQAVIRK